MLPEEPFTIYLKRFAGGDKQALDGLLPVIYEELQKLAGAYLRNEHPGRTLQPTALVREAYARLVQPDQPDRQSRAHFMAVAAPLMRRILIGHARSRIATGRSVGAVKFSLEQAGEMPIDCPSVLIAIEDALRELARRDATKARLIEMRFFGGLTTGESSQATGLPLAEVRRHLRVAQPWLQRELDRTGF